ncbi:MAG: UDP-N-acetylmuramoyl-L-alanyl-D-glutamate--2,6-diaminopimelate ligase [Firmicutes bacterium]|nr:UDP-N-acetylmuramoyl-L-alanyl-D-glutamate--2,6-diaminopimelate ligase [Bacillota bacterium]
MKKLNELYNGYPEIEIKDIKINSKEVEPGDIFVCTKGVTADRHDFIDEAVNNGASAVVVSKDVTTTVPTIKVENTNQELPLLARKLFDYPEKELKLIGVTGTNGKTTVASIIQDMMGNDICGYLGTNGIRCKNFQESIKNTTPDSDRLYKYFRRLVDNGCKYLSMETSSESFYRNRLEHLEFEIGIITNITEDHLNIHKTIENYVSCKKQLLHKIKSNGYAILNKDDLHFEECSEEVKCNLLTYGKSEATLQIVNVELEETKTNITLRYNNQNYEITSPLLGEFNVYNLSSAILAFIALGYNMEEIISRVNKINPPFGRVQFLNYNQDYKIVLDYAHTPDAFLKIFPLLHTLKKDRKIITVTGSAGGREKEKRGPMGNIVLENSDHVIFTMDDPRTESVDEIIDDLVSATKHQHYERIIDRKEAIYKAFEMAQKDDIVFVAGKGTDNYMALGNEYLPYSDLETIEEYFNNKN